MSRSLIKLIILSLMLVVFSKSLFAKNKETYEFLDLFGQIFDQVREKYVEEVTDKDLIEKLLSNFIGEKLITQEIEDFNIILSDNSLSTIIKNEKLFKKENKFCLFSK